jgi:hypothetical protein
MPGRISERMSRIACRKTGQLLLQLYPDQSSGETVTLFSPGVTNILIVSPKEHFSIEMKEKR